MQGKADETECLLNLGLAPPSAAKVRINFLPWVWRKAWLA